MIASCGFLEDELRQYSKDKGVTMADSVETLGVDLRTRVKKLGTKEQVRRKKCELRFSIIKKNKVFQKNYMKVGVKKLLRAGMVPARTWSSCSGNSSNGTIEIEETGGSSSGQQEYDLVVPCHGGLVRQKESGREHGIRSKERLG